MTRMRKRKVRTAVVWGSGALFAAVLLALLLEPALKAGTAAQELQVRRQRAAGPAKVRVGEFPPDFELPLLLFGEDAEGKPAGKISNTKTVRLSDFRGKRPVCLIMSSYT